VSRSPFRTEVAIADRVIVLASTIGTAFTDEVEASLSDDLVIPRAAVEQLIATFQLTGPREAMLLALSVAQRLADPSISGFRVGAVGLEAETGDLILGANIEFPGDHLPSTIHAEGFVFTRAFARDTSVAVLAIGEARPCGHCRQFILEFASSADLTLIDPLGHSLTMSQLLPWPFGPDDLDRPAIVPGTISWPELTVGYERLPREIADLLVETGRRAHAPYSGCPSAVVLRLADGGLVAGAPIESAAFNPTIGPVQVAVVELIARGLAYADIRSATLAIVAGGHVDVANETRALLDAIAPNAPLTVTTWA
jgi:cytidine deaminase